MNSNSVICKYIFTLKAARGNRLLFMWKPTILCILSATLIPVQWWCHILWVLWCHWLTVQFVVPLLVCVGVCDADVRASASFVPPKYFYCILSVIAYRNVIKLDSNLATAQKNRPKLSSVSETQRKHIWSVTHRHSEQRPRKLLSPFALVSDPAVAFLCFVPSLLLIYTHGLPYFMTVMILYFKSTIFDLHRWLPFLRNI